VNLGHNSFHIRLANGKNYNFAALGVMPEQQREMVLRIINTGR